MLRPHRSLILLTVCATWLSCHRNRPPAVAGIVVAGGARRALVEYEYGAVTSDPDGDSTAVRFAWDDGDTSGWNEPCLPGETAFVVHRYANPDTYYLAAQAQDRDGLLSDWCASTLIDMTGSGNIPPLTPSAPSGPSLAKITEVCTVAVVAIDPDSGSVSVHFEWGDGRKSGWSPWLASGTRTTATWGFDTTGVYQVRAQARDWSGDTSAWSEPLAVSVTAGTAPGEIKWRCGPYRYSIECSPAMAPDGTIYATGHRGLYAVGSRGQELWAYSAASYSVSSPSIGPDGTVYFFTNDSLYAIGPDGVRRWAHYMTAECLFNAPAIGADGTIYAGSTDHSLHALNTDGSLRWLFPTDDAIFGAPVIGADGTIYVGSRDSCLYAIRPDGTMLWRYQLEDWIGATASLDSDGTIYIGCHDLHALNPDGTLKWTYDIGGWIYAPATIAPDGTVHVSSADSYHHALDPDGTLKWRYKGRDLNYSAAAMAVDGTAYAGWGFGFGALRADGTLLWALPHVSSWVWSSPLIGPDGTVYVCLDGYLYALVGDLASATSAWPMYQHDPQHTGRADPSGAD